MKVVHIVMFATALLSSSCATGIDQNTVGQQITDLENGVYEMEEPTIRSVFTQEAGEPHTLAERMAHYKIPGFQIAVIKDSKVLFEKAYGVENVETGKPVTTDTMFETGSTAKLCTSILIHRLAGQGIIDLDAPANTYLKSWKIPPGEFSTGDDVTVRMLLTHTGGINRPDGDMGIEPGQVPTILQVLNGESPALNPPAMVEFTPGSKQQYSNFAYVIMELIIMDLTGRTLPDIVQSDILDLLGMTSSTFYYPFPARYIDRIATPHNKEMAVCEHDINPTATAPGNLVSTVGDLSKLALELMAAWNGTSDRLLTQAEAREFFHSECEITNPELMGFTHQGNGIFLVIIDDKNFFASHPGNSWPGSNCIFIFSPTTGDGMAALTNGRNGLELMAEVMIGVIKEFNWPKLAPRPKD